MSEKSPRPRRRKNKASRPLDPFQRHLQAVYASRTVDWHRELHVAQQPNWELLLGIHLQLTELERMYAGLQDMQ